MMIPKEPDLKGQSYLLGILTYNTKVLHTLCKYFALVKNQDLPLTIFFVILIWNGLFYDKVLQNGHATSHK